MPRSIEKCVQGAFLLSTTNNLADTFSVAHVSALALSGMTSHPDVNSMEDPEPGALICARHFRNDKSPGREFH